MIKTIFDFRNGTVVVCDEHGKQLPEYQGSLDDTLRSKIMRDAPTVGVILYSYDPERWEPNFFVVCSFQQEIMIDDTNPQDDEYTAG